MVGELGYNLRLASLDDTSRIRTAIRRTIANPEGKAHRKRFEEPIDRGELLLMERTESTSSDPELLGYIEWRGRVDGGYTIRDVGSIGEEPQPTIIRRLIREMVNLVSARPGEVTMKVRADQEPWTTLLAETPGFEVDEREYSRGAWWNIWVWKGVPDRRPPRGRR